MQRVNKSWCSLWHSIIGLQSWSPQELRKKTGKVFIPFSCAIWWKNSYNGHFSNRVYLSACGNRLKSTYILTAINLRHIFSETYAVWNINSFQVRLWKLQLHKITPCNSIIFFLLQADTHLFPLCLPHSTLQARDGLCISRKSQATTSCLCFLSCHDFHASSLCTGMKGDTDFLF